MNCRKILTQGKMMKSFLIFIGLMICSVASATAQGTLSGQIQSPNSSIPIINGSLLLTLNQSGVVVGSAAISASPINCATSIDGTIVGLLNPQSAPALVVNAGVGALGTGTYFFTYTAYNMSGETLASPEASTTVIAANSQIIVNLPAVPAGQTGWKVYASTTTGTETLQGTTATNSFTVNSLISGAAMPVTNTTVCSFRFNDTITPYPTKYRVNLTDANGAPVPGFGFYAFFTGGTVNISNGWPLARDVETRYFTPIISSPSSNAQQSINSPLTVNGFSFTAGSILLPNNATPPGCASGRSNIWTDNSGNLTACQNGGSAVQFLNAIGVWSQNGTDVRLANVTNSVLIGFNSSDLTTQGGGTSNGVKVGSFDYYIDAATNAHALSVGMLGSGNNFLAGGGPVGIIGITRSGTQAGAVPLMFVGCSTGNCAIPHEFGRISPTGTWLFGDRPLQTTDDVVTASVISRGPLGLTSQATNADVLRFQVPVGSAAIIEEFPTGAATNQGISVKTGGSETCRWDITHNFLCGTTTADDSVGTIIEAVRSATAKSAIAVFNSNNGTTATAEVYVTGGTAFGNTKMDMGVTSAAFTTAGAYFASMGFLQSNATTTNGILIDALAGPVALRTNGTTEMTITGGTGINTAHFLNAPGGLRSYAQGAVFPTGTQRMLNMYFDSGAAAAFISSSDYAGCPGACAENYFPIINTGSILTFNIGTNGNPNATTVMNLTASGLNWGTSGQGTITSGNVFLKNNGAPVFPTVNSAGLNLYYDGTLDESILASFNYFSSTWKPMVLAASGFAFNVSNDGGNIRFSQTGIELLGANSISVAAGAVTLSLANLTFPGASPGIPYRWLRFLAEDGTTVLYVPAFK